MTPTPSELARVLEALDEKAEFEREEIREDLRVLVYADAARLLRELARDFAHVTDGNYSLTWAVLARDKWRLPKEGERE